MRRVVVTGLGLVSPLGCGSELGWSRLLAARSGLAALPEWAATLPARVAGIVPIKADDPDGGFDPDWSLLPRISGGWIASSCSRWSPRPRPLHKRHGRPPTHIRSSARRPSSRRVSEA